MIELTYNAHQLKPPNPHPGLNPQHPHTSNPDTITLGCSITYGAWLNNTYSWPYIASVSTNTVINNLGEPGQDLARQIHKLIQHTDTYGTPKNLWILTPEQHRASTHIWIDNETTEIASLNWDNRISTYSIKNKEYRHQPNSPKPLHKPYEIHPEHQIARTLELLTLLQWWARHTHTNITITSWDIATRNTLTRAYPEITRHPQHPQQTPLTKWSDANLTVFHPPECDHQPQNDNQQRLWEQASDQAHPGLHTQIHIAEHFTQTTITNHHIQQLG